MIHNLIKGSQTQNTENKTQSEQSVQPTEEQKSNSNETNTNENPSVIKEGNTTTSNVSHEVRRFMTPQLSAEFSQFSGLSLRLEDDRVDTAKIDRDSIFPLKNGRPLVIGVCGGNCAGKMDLVNYLIKHLGKNRCTILKQENFYHTVPQESIEDYNYDDPEATDWEYMQKGLDALLYHKKSFHTPIYNFKLNKRDLNTEEIWPNPIIIVEGLLIFHIEGIRKRIDVKIFLDTDDDIRLSRRIMKGYLKLGRNVDSIIERYKKFVKPCHETYVLPSRKFADIIIPNFGSSVVEELELYKDNNENQVQANAKMSNLKTNLPLELVIEQIKDQLGVKQK